MSKQEKLKECQYCELPFIYKRKHSKYCCDSCKQKAYLKRKSNIQMKVTVINIVPEKKPSFIKRLINWFRKK